MKKYNILHRKSNIVRFRASDKLINSLKEESEKTGLSISSIVRIAINKHLVGM